MDRRAGWLLVVLLLVACTAPLTALPTPTLPPDLYLTFLSEGDTHIADNARTAAEAAYRQAAALRPSDPAPYLRLAQLYLEWNRPEEGLETVLAAERLGGSPAQVNALRAALYAAQTNWEATIVYGERALALNSSDRATRHLVAQGHIALGHPEEAQAHYGLLLEIDPSDRLAHEQLGALLVLSDPAGAVPHLEAANTPLASDMRRMLLTSIASPAYRLTRAGRICLLHQEPRLAALALRRALSHSPTYADAHALLGQALDQLGLSHEAEEHLKTAVRLAPDSALAHSLLGLHYLRAGDPTAARPHLEAAYDLDADNPAFSLYLAYTYADLGQYGVAQAWLEEATRLAPRDPTLKEQVARFYLERGMGPKGLEAALDLAEQIPRSAVAQDLLGWAYFLCGRYGEAQEHLDRAIELDPLLPSAYYYLGALYAYQGEETKARSALTRALDLNTEPGLRSQIEALLQSAQGSR